MSEQDESPQCERRTLRIVPPKNQDPTKPTLAQGTEVYTASGEKVGRVTRIELTAACDDVWRGVIHVLPESIPEITAECEIVEDYAQ